jgi:hypothetical protein
MQPAAGLVPYGELVTVRLDDLVAVYGYAKHFDVDDDPAVARIARVVAGARQPSQPEESVPDVHVDWHMTPQEWDQLNAVLWRSRHVPYIARLVAEGKVPEPQSNLGEFMDFVEDRLLPGVVPDDRIPPGTVGLVSAWLEGGEVRSSSAVVVNVAPDVPGERT